jgi:hypothetical protein
VELAVTEIESVYSIQNGNRIDLTLFVSLYLIRIDTQNMGQKGEDCTISNSWDMPLLMTVNHEFP